MLCWKSIPLSFGNIVYDCIDLKKVTHSVIYFSVPKPVVNLTATLENGNTIQVDWSAPEESIQDHYVIRHRAILRDSDALWAENSRLNTNFTLSNLFPGERYEIEVYAVKNGIKSEAQNISQVTGKYPL